MKKLITFLGNSDYSSSKVFYNNKFLTEDKFAAIGIAKIIFGSDDYGEIDLFVTPQAFEKNYNSFLDAFSNEFDQNIKIHKVEYNFNDEIVKLFEKLINIVSENDEIYIDITSSPRSITMYFLIFALYYDTFQENQLIKNIYYSYFDKSKKTSNIESMEYLLDIPKRILSVQLFRNYGNGSVLVSEINKIKINLLKDKQNEKNKKYVKILSKFDSTLNKISVALDFALIKEIKESLSILENLEDEKNEIIEILKKFAPEYEILINEIFDNFIGLQNPGKDLVLTMKELEFEHKLLKWFYENSFANFVKLAREYFINLYMYSHNQNDLFLDTKTRENDFHYISNFADKEINSIIQLLREIRNNLAHSGFKDKSIKIISKKEKLGAIIDKEPSYWLNILRKKENRRDDRNKVLLITPLGTSPGVVYTALKQSKPDYCLIVTSDRGSKKIPEILEKAEFQEDKVRIIKFTNPFYGFDEIEDKIKSVENVLESFGTIKINFSGGTSFLQYVVQKLKDRISNSEIQEFFAVDRRSYDEQKNAPYVVGEWIDIPFDG